MANNRNELAEKLEIIGGMFEVDGMSELLGKFEADTDEKGNKRPVNPVKFNAILIQITGLLLKENQRVADRIVMMNRGITEEEVGKLADEDYAAALRSAIITDVLGFFASSPRSEGRK